MDRHSAEQILSRVRELNVASAEVFVRSFAVTTVEVKDQQVDAFERARDIGAGLRVIIDGRQGFAFTTDLSPDSLGRLAQQAVTAAMITQPDPFFAIPGKSGSVYPQVRIYDPEIPRLDEREKIDRTMALEREAFGVDPRIKRIRKASASFSESETLILNSAGGDSRYQSTACSASIEVVAEERGESQAGSDFDVARFYRKLGFEEVGRKAAQRALDLLGARTIPSIKAPVVLEATVAQEFLSLIAGSFSAESVQKKRSIFRDKLDAAVASSLVTVYDDGLLDGGIGTAPSDDEAVPLRTKTMIHEGRLAGYLYNTYTANKDRTESTGNGMRGGFKGIPGVGITNLSIKPGEGSLEALLRQAGKGLLVTEVMGMHTANPISGDFSVGATGFWIEKGAKAYPVREITIAGNIIELLKNVAAVGADLRFSGRIGSPSLLIKELSIAGK